jgi:xanthine dehydrogenase YagT iron-sulfur-binding subunit
MRIRLRRRRFGQLTIVGVVIATVGNWIKQSIAQPNPPSRSALSSGKVAVNLKINGATYLLKIEPRVSLLDALRDFAGLTGTKKGCNQGACGACTVLVNGDRINSCLALAVQYQGAEITTIEGLATDGKLHPLQAAFIEHDGFQCGYCTPGQICSAIGMLREFQNNLPSAISSDMNGKYEFSDAEIKERMSGNLCRCSAYHGITEAIHTAFKQEAQ